MTAAIKGLSSMATRQILAELAETYSRDTGCAVAMEATGGVRAAQRVRDGEQLDVVILASGAMSKLEGEGLLVAGSLTDIARSAIAIAVAADAPSPAIDTADAVREAMLHARSVSYSTGPSGDHLQALWSRWALSDLMASKAVPAPPGVPVALLVAKGEAEIGVQQLSELQGAAGVKVVGLLPPEIQQETGFMGGIASASYRLNEARKFLDYLGSPKTMAVKHAYGMRSVIGSDQSMGLATQALRHVTDVPE